LDQGARVTFKDYGFFVPTDAQGSKARVEGVVSVRELSAADVSHLESEGGKFPSKAADGTARELSIVATGVELWRS
jgi:mRNA-degrading endonuclease toxin of MazEF toxin-antitoxin module